MSTPRGSNEATPADSDERTPPAAGRAQETIALAQEATQKVMGWFPVRVFQRFSARNGMVLAAGASYQALFAIFAAVYVAFAGVGLWLGGSAEAIDRLIGVINQYLPGVIGDEPNSVISQSAVHDIAGQSVTTLGITGVVALLVVFWTAIGWIGSIRTTVRDIFGLTAERGNPVLLKVRDLIAALGFALLLLIGAVLGWAGTSALQWLFGLLGWTDSTWLAVLGSSVTFLVMFLVDTVTLLMLFRFLTGLSLSTRDVLPGSLIGAAGVSVLQVAFGFLIGKTPSNPLLVTFAVLIGLLLWIRLVMMAILLAAAWVAEAADDKQLVLERLTEREKDIQVALVLRDAALIDRDDARAALAQAGFWRRPRARFVLTRAEENVEAREDELARLAPTAPELLAAQTRAGTRV